LRLSGTPADHVTHAWEDVKAMFNGGTRKRLVSGPSSSSSSHHIKSSSGQSSKVDISSSRKLGRDVLNNLPQNSPQTANHHPSRNHNHASAGNSAINNQLSISQINSPPASVPPSSSSSSSATPRTPTAAGFNQELPFSLSRSFMLDYMWHQHQHQPNSIAVANKANFHFPPYSALNWIKQQPSSFLFKPNNGTSLTAPPLNPTLASSAASTTSSSMMSEEKPSAFNHFHSAAFKPVINMRLNNDDIHAANATMVASATTPTSITKLHNHSPTSSTTSSNCNHTTASSTNQSDDEMSSVKKMSMNRKKCHKEYNVSDSMSQNKMRFEVESLSDEYNENLKDNNSMSDSENEVVDIETTEDDVQVLNLQPFRSSLILMETDDEIDVSTVDKISQGEFNNNNNINNNFLTHFDSSHHTMLANNTQSPIKSLKDIVQRNDHNFEENSLIKKSLYISSSSPNVREWSFKKELN
jgi:hypothetical protein